jgi:endonuclease/exonuclease/phosphatase family metal-dependent hydrolase
MLVVSVHVVGPDYRQHLRTLVDDLSVAIEGQRFVIGGDLNAARHLDDVYGGQWFTHFFEDLARRNFYDCHWARHGKEVQSFWGHQARQAYQCDHYLVDAATNKDVIGCHVIDNTSVRQLSDHGPIQLDLGIGPRGTV